MRIDEEVAALQQMTVGELHERYAEVFGEPARSRHKQYLVRRIAWRLQANAEGDLSERARRRAEDLAEDAEVRTTPPRDAARRHTTAESQQEKKAPVSTDPRLPSPGTSITRNYKGKTIEVRILRDGLEYDGRRFKSLSAVAKAITGSHMNGFRFFNLGGNR
jgi:hypothetical protein